MMRSSPLSRMPENLYWEVGEQITSRHLRTHDVERVHGSSVGRPYGDHVKRPDSCAAGSASNLPAISEPDSIHLDGGLGYCDLFFEKDYNFWSWDKPIPTGVAEPETDPLALTAGHLDDYFIRLMEPMMRFLEREDEERVEAPLIKLDHCSSGEK